MHTKRNFYSLSRCLSPSLSLSLWRKTKKWEKKNKQNKICVHYYTSNISFGLTTAKRWAISVSLRDAMCLYALFSCNDWKRPSLEVIITYWEYFPMKASSVGSVFQVFEVIFSSRVAGCLNSRKNDVWRMILAKFIPWEGDLSYHAYEGFTERLRHLKATRNFVRQNPYSRTHLHYQPRRKFIHFI